MATHAAPVLDDPRSAELNEVFLIASGDMGQSANQTCWPAECSLQARLRDVFQEEGFTLRLAHPFEPGQGDGFLYNQHLGNDVFAWIPEDAPVVVAEAVWHCSNDIFEGLASHKGPILTLANWSGEWPGLLGTLNLNGSLHKAGTPFSTLASADFEDPQFRKNLGEWLRTGRIEHDQSHVREFHAGEFTGAARTLGASLAAELRRAGAKLGVIAYGCEPMTNAVIDQALLAPLGASKQELRPGLLAGAMLEVSDAEAMGVREWLETRGVKFVTGPCEEGDLTDGQILEQCRMYIAAVRIAAENGCDAIGIHYEEALKHLMPAPDLAEGLLNNVDRPPVYGKDGTELLRGQALPHFNEADECAGLDALITNRVWTGLGLDPATTLHDIRSGEYGCGDGPAGFFWVLQIAGAVPASHLIGGYAGAVSERQPPLYYPLGGGTLKGLCKPGEMVWSRIFVEGDCLHADLGRATAVELKPEEAYRAWQRHTPQWPLLSGVFHGVSAEQFLVRQRSNHVNVAYATTAEAADTALQTKAAMLAELGVLVHLCGV
jgi:hypothetical protein